MYSIAVCGKWRYTGVRNQDCGKTGSENMTVKENGAHRNRAWHGERDRVRLLPQMSGPLQIQNPFRRFLNIFQQLPVSAAVIPDQIPLPDNAGYAH